MTQGQTQSVRELAANLEGGTVPLSREQFETARRSSEVEQERARATARSFASRPLSSLRFHDEQMLQRRSIFQGSGRRASAGADFIGLRQVRRDLSDVDVAADMSPSSESRA